MRTINFLKNVLAGFFSKLLGQILGFIVRTVFIYTLSSEFLGINGLFTSVLAFLNLSELGLGSAIVFSLYEPLATNNQSKTRVLMKFYKNAYRVIGGIVLVLGIGIIPFLPMIIKGDTGPINIYIIYLLFLLDTVLSYWCWAYKSSLLIADQREFISINIRNKTDIGKSVVRILFLLLLKDYAIASFYIYTVLGIVFTVTGNLLIGRKVDREYAYLLEPQKDNISAAEKKGIFEKVIGLSAYRLSSTVNNAMDTILISAFIGIGINGIYSNYTLLISIINGMIWIIVTSLIPGIGNLYSTKDKDKLFEVFKSICIIFFFIYGVCGVGICVLTNTFIGEVWLSSDYLLDMRVVVILFLNFITGGMLTAFSVLVEATGSFAKRGMASVLSVMINVGLSIWFLKFTEMEITGVVLATIIARMVSIAPMYIRIVAKDIFRKKQGFFWLYYIAALTVTSMFALFLYYMMNLIKLNHLLGFIIKGILCVVISGGIWLLCLYRTKEFQYIKNRIRGFVKR